MAGARHHPPRDPGILPLAPSSDVLRGLPGRLLDKYEPSVKEQPSSTNPPAPSAKCEPIGERARYRGERKPGETPEFKDWQEWEGEVVSGHFYTEDLECEPEWPWACTACWAKAEELQSSAIVCAEFMHMVLLGMFDAAGGYRHAYVYIDNFEAHWRHHQPEQLLHAASLSLYPPDMAAIKDWCKHQYPALAYILWTPRTIGRYACSSQALDTLD